MFYDLEILEGLVSTIKCLIDPSSCSGSTSSSIASNIISNDKRPAVQHIEPGLTASIAVNSFKSPSTENASLAKARDFSDPSTEIVIVIAQKIREFSSAKAASEHNDKILGIFRKYDFEYCIVYSECNVNLWQLILN